MKLQLSFAFGILIFLCSCQKSQIVKNEDLNAQRIASKYNLKLKNEYTSNNTKTFSTLAEFQKFMDSRSLKDFSDTVRSANLKEISNTNKTTTNSYDSGSADGLPYSGIQYHQYSVNFSSLEQSGYASLGIFGISQNDVVKLEDFGIYNNGASAGTFTYLNTFINQHPGNRSLDATVYGNYVETYGVGGIYTYYQIYRSTFTVKYDLQSSGFFYCTLTYDRIK